VWGGGLYIKCETHVESVIEYAFPSGLAYSRVGLGLEWVIKCVRARLSAFGDLIYIVTMLGH
jgi:hypothetical protein